MPLKEQIQAELKAALLSGSRFDADVLRGLKAAILNEEVASGKRDEGLGDEEIEKVVAREVKKRAESIKLYEENSRPELAENERNEIAILERYLPAQMSEAELEALVDETIASLSEVTMQQMGQVIGAVKAKAGNAADGALIAQLVKAKLSK
ncbi:hypothetical protein RAAC3_TM7C00001G0524 [Candidatus Saccharibacteria bacterium RAAC3_TM7_1]|nr:hypothetical protein RAAC3_TM7C00001G0524 [Candidatus Saccharibacteria bacterium RAAC3_TM7_1]HCZ28651.1 GatB/YqeY [Candidatus Saccharibacteria bacterium]